MGSTHFRTGLWVVMLMVCLSAAAGWADLSPGGGPLPGPALEIKRPDLIITTVQVGLPAAGANLGYSALNVWVRVRNLGPGTAPRTTVAVVALNLDLADPLGRATVEAEVPRLAVGAAEWVVLPFLRTTLRQGYLLAVADRPTAAKPHGVVLEGEPVAPWASPPRELNNAFGFAFTVEETKMLTYPNPAAK